MCAGCARRGRMWTWLSGWTWLRCASTSLKRYVAAIDRPRLGVDPDPLVPPTRSVSEAVPRSRFGLVTKPPRSEASSRSVRDVAEGALVEIVDGVADLIPVSAARQSFELGGQPIALLGGRLGEAHVEATQKRIVAQGEQRNCRAGL